MSRKKPVIVFEGIEGTGKSYHLSKISKYLTKKKIPHLRIREPGGSNNSEKIRKLILSNKSTFNKETDLFLYLAARSENMTLLKRNYKKKVILIDRFIDSTIAYQHYGQGVDLKLIESFNKYLIRNFNIDFTFLNIVNKKNMIERLKKRKSLNRYDKFNHKFYQRVQNGFLKIFNKKKKKYKLINSNLKIDKNTTLILEKVKKLI